jgi:hypothetical protein
MRCNVIDSTAEIYTGDFGRGEGVPERRDFGLLSKLLSLGRNLELEHMVTIDGYFTVCRRRRRNNRHDAPRG